MAITATDLKQMQRDIETLKKQVARLERRGNGKPRVAAKKSAAALPLAREMNENKRADEILRRAGMLTELTPEEKAMAAEWRALPEERKQEVIRALETANFKPTLSEIIIQNRG
jgi:cell division septum initiation protein DivIVA